MRDALLKHLESQPTSLIFFYMPDCGSCKEIKPEILKFAKNKKLPLFQIPTTTPDWKELSILFDVHDFPTLFYVEKMKVKHQYMGLDEIREIIFLES
jgi:thiol-disulfide isomerase/thioredoxin